MVIQHWTCTGLQTVLLIQQFHSFKCHQARMYQLVVGSMLTEAWFPGPMQKLISYCVHPCH